MKITIEIPEDMYKRIQDDVYSKHDPVDALKLVRNGVPVPTSDWILTTTQLPKDDQKCLISLNSYVEIADYSTNLYEVDQYDFWDKENTPGFYGYDSEYGFFEWSEVIAWMPLPQPYISNLSN